MKQKLVDLLMVLGYPVFLQGSLNPDEEYPDSFFTFWVFQADEKKHYDDRPVSCEWGFWIYFYTDDPELIMSEPLKAKKMLMENRFVFQGKPVDVKSDKPSHTGTMLTCYIIENY